MLNLAPWTPALVPDEANTAATLVRSRQDGQTAIAVEPGKSSLVVLSWKLAARPGSSGHVFALGLPRCAVSSLSLDVPSALSPEGAGGLRRGPLSGQGPDRQRWEFEGPTGEQAVELRFTVREGQPRAQPPVWISGPTDIEIKDAEATWQSRWTVDLGPDAPRELAIDVAPELEIVAVEGAGVVTHDVRHAPASPPRLTITLADGVAGPVPVTIRAVPRLPDEGVWKVPWLRPVGASWTGGRVALRLVGGMRTLMAVRALQGPPIAPHAEDLEARPARGLLLFDPATPNSVAELTFHRSEAEVTGEIRGGVFLGADRPHLEALLTLTVERGTASSLVLDVPEPWMPDRMELADTHEPVTWQVQPGAGGGSRMVVFLSSPLPSTPLTLRLTALADRLESTGTWQLPRLAPAGVRLTDERWVLGVDPEILLSPGDIAGLAWIDPDQVGIEVPASLSPALSWRWIDPQGRGRVAVRRHRARRESEIIALARVEAQALDLDVAVRVEAAADTSRSGVPVLYDGPAPAAPPVWNRWDKTGSTPLLVRSVTEREHERYGWPARGQGWLLPAPATGSTIYRTHFHMPWTGRGAIPLVRLAAREPQRSVVLIAVDRTLKAHTEVRGVRRLDFGSAILADLPDVGLPTPDPARYRTPDGFATALAPDPNPITLTTEPLQLAESPGVVLAAVLRGTADTSRPTWHQLQLTVLAPGRTELEIGFQDGTAVQQVVVDGQRVAPVWRAATLVVPLFETPSAAAPAQVQVDFQPPPGKARSEGRSFWPRVWLPCLATTWLLTTPADSRRSCRIDGTPRPGTGPRRGLGGSTARIVAGAGTPHGVGRAGPPVPDRTRSARVRSARETPDPRRDPAALGHGSEAAGGGSSRPAGSRLRAADASPRAARCPGNAHGDRLRYGTHRGGPGRLSAADESARRGTRFRGRDGVERGRAPGGRAGDRPDGPIPVGRALA